MNFSFERLYALFLIIPAIIISIKQYKKVSNFKKEIYNPNAKDFTTKRLNNFSKIIFFRTLFRIIAWILLVLAYAGFSWGTYLEPVQKNGNAVTFVFDISYSMMAKDGPDKKTRLESSANYAKMLLSHLEGTAISVVLAKGDGVVVVPLTEDKAVVESLIDSLNPKLISSTGSSLGKGVNVALKSFPSNSSLANRIFVFTDGDETDGLLEKSLQDCKKSGVCVSLIGFGSEQEISVLSGDGKTSGYTSLKSAKMKKIVNNVMKGSVENNNGVVINYIDATEIGSALKLLKPLSVKASNDKNSSITYELKPVKRYRLFLGLALCFFIFSFIVSELNINITKKIKKTSLVSICLLSVIFSSCSLKNNGIKRIEGANRILKSSWAFYLRNYNEATAGYLQTLTDSIENEDLLLKEYSTYNLATTYLMKNEYKAAFDRYVQIEDSDIKDIKYATFYNMGIIAHRNGQYKQAIECFINALKIDGTKTSAKINLELSRIKAEKEGKTKQKVKNSISEEKSKDSKENTLFNVVKELDKQQWKNSQSQENSLSASDF